VPETRQHLSPFTAGQRALGVKMEGNEGKVLSCKLAEQILHSGVGTPALYSTALGSNPNPETGYPD
jgi:hypothetical protein